MDVKGLWINENTFVAFQGEKRSLAKEIATRERFIDFYSLGMYLPNPDPVLKKMGKDITVYKELVSDAHVSSCIESRKSGVKSMLWEIDRGKSKSRQAKFIEDIFDNLDIYDIISEILDYSWYGYQPLEVMWKSFDAKWLPEKVVGKPPDWFVFGDNNELRFRTRTDWNGEEVPQRKFLLPRHNDSYANPYGDAVASKCFWPVTFKKGGLKFWVTFTEKYGMPWPVGKYPRGTGEREKNDLLDMLEKMVQDGIAVIPDDSSLDFMEMKSGTASVQIYKSLLEFNNAEISKAVIGQTLTTEVGARGSYAASKTHQEVRRDIVDADKIIVEATFNRLIDWIVDYNFGNADRPKFIMYEEEDVDLQLAERDEKLSNTGQVKFTKKYFQRNYGFADDEIEVTDPQPKSTEFSEPGNEQTAIDTFIDAIPDILLQKQAETILQPVLEFVENAASYEDILNNVAKLYPQLNTKEIENLVAKAMFVAETWGRNNNN